jgi:hypothetical protein
MPLPASPAPHGQGLPVCGASATRCIWMRSSPIEGAAALPRLLVEVSKLTRERRYYYLLVESTGISELLRIGEPRPGRRTVLTFPLLAPPQKN